MSGNKMTVPPPHLDTDDDAIDRVRELRDFKPLQVGLRPILPNPRRDLSFTNLTGWRYYPGAPFWDRLGTSRTFSDEPSTTMTIPDSWTDKDDNNMVVESTREQLADLQPLETFKRPRLDEPSKQTNPSSSATISTAGLTSSSSSSAQPNFLEIFKSIPRVNPPVPPPATFVPPPATTSTTPPPSSSSTCTTTTTMASGVVPKAALYVLYGKKPRRVQLKASDYLTWDNGLRTHELKYTSAFVCPLSKEIFLAGKYGDAFTKDGWIVWYAKKAQSEHAAAARSLDCWHLREHIPERIGPLEEPYHKGEEPTFPTNQMPPIIVEQFQEIRKQQKELATKELAMAAASKPKPPELNPNSQSNHNGGNQRKVHRKNSISSSKRGRSDSPHQRYNPSGERGYERGGRGYGRWDNNSNNNTRGSWTQSERGSGRGYADQTTDDSSYRGNYDHSSYDQGPQGAWDNSRQGQWGGSNHGQRGSRDSRDSYNQRQNGNYDATNTGQGN
jgi:hypothetical protein